MLSLFGRGNSEREQRDELLSAYLDGELSKSERERLEARLSEDAALRGELRAMHRTVSMMGELPQVAAPRNYILSESMVRREKPVSEARRARPEGERGMRAWAAPLLTAAATAMSLLFLVVLLGDFLVPGVGGLASAPAPMRQAEEAPEVALEAAPTEEMKAEASETADMASPRATETEGASPEFLEQPEIAAEEESEAPKEEAEADLATRIARAPAGTGATPPPAITSVRALTPTIPAEEPVVSEEELGLVEPTQEQLDVTPEFDREGQEIDGLVEPSLSWSVLEVALGLASLVLGFAAVRAWRLRGR